ncbi:MAG: hypothetical protein AB1425_18615 [Actinomycetota bacterium]
MAERRQAPKTKVLMANEPRAYRQSIAEVLRELRPGVEILTADPASLDESVLSLEPAMVVCSRATETVRLRVPVWVELYPGHGPVSTVSFGGRIADVEDMGLSDLLSLVDRAVEMTG